MARATKTGKDDKGKKHSKSGKQESPKKTDQGHHFRCLPKTVATMYNECLCKSEEKMALIEELGFGAFSHLPDYNLKQHMLKELVNIYDIHDIHDKHNTLCDPFDERVSEKDLNDEDYAIFKMFQGKSQADLTMLVKRTPVDTEANRNLFKRAFLIFIQKAKLNKTKAVHGCCYVMMIIYFHETHFGKDSREPEAQPPWIQYLTGENLRKRLHREQNHSIGLVQTGLLRAAKEKLQKRNMDLKMSLNLRRREPSSSESESKFDSK
ncbi:hypothetical protein PIB30_027928 [Stylosanthes scabra]|uniref:Uncharacterized protein n=1 Tax=Stylosanthes scabra TaxID=79078 RepID=A0ABU6QBB2_9FABA|nr:hypothetical protein [Stylosanthes scabra]